MKLKLIGIFAALAIVGVGIGIGSALLYRTWFMPDQRSFVTLQHTVTQTSGKPFLLGFTSLSQEVSIKKLKVQGKIPSWINGTFVSIGPGKFEINESKATHWLDGFAMVHRFHIESGNASYANKLIKTNYLEEALKKGKITGTNPDQKESKWSKLKGALSSKSTRPVYDNVNINIFALGSQLMALTETPQPICLDCHTLETKHAVKFKDTIGAHFSSGHPLFDPNTREWFNVGIQYAMHSSYVIYKIPENSHERIVVATIKVDKPSYMHSFALTEHYVILTELPLRVSAYDLLMGTKSFIDTHQWNPNGNTVFTVVDRHTGKTVGTFKTHPFFALHHVNAFEKDGKIDIDIITYKDLAVLKALGFDHLYHADQHHFPMGTFERFELNLATKKVHSRKITDKNIEMPQINYRMCAMHPYTFVYGDHLTSSTELANELIKINVKNGSSQKWSAKDCYPTEPIFIAAPQAKAEDDGAILCVVLDTHTKQSFLLVLDAKNMKELARIYVPHHIPFTVHSGFLKLK